MLKICAKLETTLAAGISATASAATIVSADTQDGDGSTLPAGTYGFVIDEGNSNEEYIIATVSGTSLTITKRGLAYYDGDTEKTENKKAHRKGASVKIVDHPVIARIIRVLNGEDEVSANIESSIAPTDDEEYANKAYVDGVAIAGGADASTSVKGLSKLSSAPASPTEPIAVGDNDPRVPSTDEKAALAGNSGTPSASNKFVTEASLIGEVKMYSGSSAPTGWLLCDGSAISRTTYAALFAITGETYGVGDGSTTFNLPDLKGRVPVGKDSSQAEFDTLGETGGAKTHQLTIAELAAHTHGTNFWNTSGASTPHPLVSTANTDGGAEVSTDSTGGGSAHNNLQPYLVLNYIIKH